MSYDVSNRHDTSFSWLVCALSFLHNTIVGATYMAPAIYLSDWIDEFDVTRGEAASVSSIFAATISLCGEENTPTHSKCLNKE